MKNQLEICGIKGTILSLLLVDVQGETDAVNVGQESPAVGWESATAVELALEVRREEPTQEKRREEKRKRDCRGPPFVGGAFHLHLYQGDFQAGSH
ncbi:hypothetical protein U1Q18_007030 [Sarracenia purpurea var. burkii]